MKIERYIGVMVVLVVGLFLATLTSPELSFAKGQTIRCYAPVSTWSVPATSGTATEGTVCTTNAPACQVVTYNDTPWDLVGSILRAPFEMAQCVLGGACP